mmetsp:Transcript_5281/g.11570  ORF Transcript_5281/g.11570 Transcript_5281/m.11570 type:complete len:264 (+) Transcript_5281:140-931(+)
MISLNQGFIAATFAYTTIRAIPAHCFTLPTYNLPFSSRQKFTSSTAILESANEKNVLFDTPGWQSIKKDLDQVPVFACANAEGQPMKYRIDLAKKTGEEESVFDVPLFYTHVDDALAELKKARESADIPGMDINPYPLGEIFQMWATDKAVIIPNKNAILQAGAPPNSNPMGQNVPLFACMEIAQENEDGKPVLPLFMELEDANAAVKEAVSYDGGKEEEFEVVCLSLPGAIEMLANADEKSTAFHFIPPSTSLKHIRDYLSN